VLSVSTTTRERRAREREGIDYHYVTREEFLRRVEQGDFLEWAEYGGHLYGTPAGAVWAQVRAGHDVILEIELQGARQVMQRVPEAVVAFIAPRDLKQLEARLRLRGTETEEAIRRRMEHARDEMDALARSAAGGDQEFDYVIVNDVLDTAAEHLRDAIEEIRATDTER
jgi:guanylate kinase